MIIGPTIHYAVQAGDISSGAIKLRLFAKVDFNSLQVVANSNFPLQVGAANLGQ